MASELTEEGELPNSAALHRTGTCCSRRLRPITILVIWSLFFLCLDLGSHSLRPQEAVEETCLKVDGRLGDQDQALT